MSQTNHRRCNRGNTTTNKRVASTPVSSTISRTTYLLPPFLLLSFLGVSHASELLDRSAPAFVAAAAAATATATAATTTTAPSIVGHNSAPSAAAAATAAATAVGSTHGSRRPFHLSASTKPQLSLPAVDEQSHEAACVPPPTTTTAAGGNKKDGDNSSIITAFKKDFTQPMGIPEEGIEAAVAVMRTGRLFRYSCANAETSQVAQAEREFAESVGARFAVGVNSCSSAILVALLGVGVRPGDEVLTNAFTFTAVPCAVLRLGAEPVLVECSASWTMDLDDLERKAASSSAKILLLSHMRGKVCDMDRVAEICERRGLTLVEDCAHACGVTWRGRPLGYHAKVAAYSTQSDKVINSGEGGFVVTSDDEVAARAIFLSGAYERRFDKHLVRPSDALCEKAMLTEPNLSLRMSEITAAVMRPLLRSLPERVVEYNKRYRLVVDTMETEAPGLIEVPVQDGRAGTVGDHLNFRLVGARTEEDNIAFQAKCKQLGVPVSWLRSSVNARWHVNWRGFGGPVQDLPATDRALGSAYDLKLPPHFEDADFVHVGRNIAHAALVTIGGRAR